MTPTGWVRAWRGICRLLRWIVCFVSDRGVWRVLMARPGATIGVPRVGTLVVRRVW